MRGAKVKALYSGNDIVRGDTEQVTDFHQELTHRCDSGYCALNVFSGYVTDLIVAQYTAKGVFSNRQNAKSYDNTRPQSGTGKNPKNPT